LAALTTRPAQVYVFGSASATDQLGAVYNWVAGSAASADGFNIVAPTGGGASGRWFRQTSSGVPANNGVLVTNGSGVPSISTTLPNGLAMGTPASITLTNGTGLPISTGVSGLGTGVATFLGTPSSANLRAAITDETGTGAAFFANGNFGNATGTSATLTQTGTSQSLVVNQQPSGTVSSTDNDLNGVFITNGNLDAGANLVSGFTSRYIQNGSSTRADNGVFAMFADLQVNTQSSANNQSYGALIARALALTSTSISGFSLTGLNSNVAIGANVTGVTEIRGHEMDMTVNSGANPISKFGYVTVLGATDAVQGSGTDASFYWTMQPGTSPGWKHLFYPDATNGTIMSSDGAIFDTRGSLTITTGFKIGWTVAGNAFESSGFHVTGAGALTASSSTLGVATMSAGSKVGTGSGQEYLFINGGNSASSDGGCLFIQNASSTNGWFGNPSACSGGAFSGNMGIFASNALVVTSTNFNVTPAGAVSAASMNYGGGAFTVTAANSVSPTSPNRTITISLGGTTYYLAAKTTND
jgi:hypothetical protein